MGRHFSSGTVVLDTFQNEVLRVQESNMLNTVAVTLDGTQTVTVPTDVLVTFRIPAATV